MRTRAARFDQPCSIPGDPIEAGDRDGAPYAAWIKTGHLAPIGNSTDPRVITNKIAELNGLHRFRGLAFDRWRVAEITRELDAIGCSVPLVEHGQGYKDMSPAINMLEGLVLGASCGTAIIRCCSIAPPMRSSRPISQEAEARPGKTASASTLVALTMALSAATLKKRAEADQYKGFDRLKDEHDTTDNRFTARAVVSSRRSRPASRSRSMVLRAADRARGANVSNRAAPRRRRCRSR